MKKQNKRIINKKTRLNNLHAFVQALTANFATVLFPYFTYIFYCRSSAPLLSCLESLTFLPSCFIPNLLSSLVAVLLSYFLPILVLGFLAILLPFFLLNSTLTYLVFLVLEIFK